MGEPLPRSCTPATTVDADFAETGESGARPKTQYLPYRPPGSEYTPPASPRPSSPYAISASRPGFGSVRSKNPVNLQMDTAAPPAYERPTYSPSPSSSPPLPPLPSPHFPPRQRAPSLLRHAASSSPLNDGHPRAERSVGSPTFAPSMLRQGSGQGPTSDPRNLPNPLASNPIGYNELEPLETMQKDELVNPKTRARGLTSNSHQGYAPRGFGAHPQLRATTSIPDYGQFRGSDRPNPSGAYRPDRGGANWSHNEFHPPRHVHGEEPRASFRSAWTNASSIIDASGTERSSMATGRSSTASDNRVSVVSRIPSEHSGVMDGAESVDPLDDEFDAVSAVQDVIDAYCYGNDEDVHGAGYTRDSPMVQSPVDASDAEEPDLSRSFSQGGSSHLTSEPNVTPDSPRHLSRPVSYVDDSDDINEALEEHTRSSYYNSQDSDHLRKPLDERDGYLPPFPKLSPLQLQYTAAQIRPPSMAKRISVRRSYHDVETSPTQTRQSVWPSTEDSGAIAVHPASERSDFRDIYNELKDLPQLPKAMSRISRQDWQDFQAYANKNIKDGQHSRENSKEKPNLTIHVPAARQTDSLPEVDEDQAYPRRASTSVFDRKSTLLDLNKTLYSPPPPQLQKANTMDHANQGNNSAKPHLKADFTRDSPMSPMSPRGPPPSPGVKLPPTAFARDRYGFKKATDKISVQEHDVWYTNYEQYVARRRAKWVTLMEKQGLMTINPVQFPEPSEKVRRYARKGYPPEWRGQMWWFYSGGQEKLSKMKGVYARLLTHVRNGELNKDDREAIERDLDRTFPDNIHFRPDPTVDNPDCKTDEEPQIMQDLREVLQCFALNNPGIGYCQSLNFIAGLLLLFMKQDNERVFILLTIITQTHLPGAHARSLANAEVNVLMMLIREYLPKVWASINDTDLVNSGAGSNAHPDSKFTRQPTVALSCTSWFMSLFVGVLPIEVVLRVWDAFLFEGPRALFRYALAIFKLGEPEIRKFHPGDGELFMTVQNLPRQCLDPNILHDIAFVKKGFGSLSQSVIDQKRQFWAEQLAHERSGRRAPVSPSERSAFLDVHHKDSGDEREQKRNGSMGNLRRKASRRFFRKEK